VPTTLIQSSLLRFSAINYQKWRVN